MPTLDLTKAKLNWRPDTCLCSFEVIIDENSGMIFGNLHNACDIHKADTGEQSFALAHADNQYKNRCIASVEADYSVPAAAIQWSFDNNRNLSLFHESLSSEQIQSSIDKVPKQ